MAEMKIAGLSIIPDVVQEYTNKLILERSALFRSGLIASVPAYIPSKGKVTTAPYYLGFTGADEVLSDAAPLVVNPVTSSKEVAVINFRGKAFGANDLVDALAGQDPLGDLASKFADYWVCQFNRAAVSTIVGSAAGVDVTFPGKILGVSAPLTADAIIDAKYLAGEYADALTIMVVHSAVKAQLHKNDLTKDVVIDSVGTTITTYMGMTLVVDDTLVGVAGVYPVILSAPGALLYANGTDPQVALETDRDILAGSDIVTSRQRFIMHPGGATWVGPAAGLSPTNAELQAAAHWAGADSPLRYGFRVAHVTLV